MNIYCLLPNLLQYKSKLTTRSHQYTHTTCAQCVCITHTQLATCSNYCWADRPPSTPAPHMNQPYPLIWAGPTVQLLVTRHKLDQMSVSRILRIQLSKINCKIKSILSHMGSTFWKIMTQNAQNCRPAEIALIWKGPAVQLLVLRCSHITSAKIGGSKTPPPRQQWSAFG